MGSFNLQTAQAVASYHVDVLGNGTPSDMVMLMKDDRGHLDLFQIDPKTQQVDLSASVTDKIDVDQDLVPDELNYFSTKYDNNKRLVFDTAHFAQLEVLRRSRQQENVRIKKDSDDYFIWEYQQDINQDGKLDDVYVHYTLLTIPGGGGTHPELAGGYKLSPTYLYSDQ